MRNNKGFTLLELLIAATLVGILAVFATIAYRNTAADARMGSAKTRTEALAGAVQRYRLENPTAVVFAGPMQTLTSVNAPCNFAVNSVQELILCHYVDNGGWTDAYVNFYVCNGKTSECANSPVNNPLACMAGTSFSKQPNRYRESNGYIYCVSATEKQETLGSD